MSETHNPAEAIGVVTHWFGHISVAGVSLKAPLAVGDRIHIKGHSTDIVQTVTSMQIEHEKIESAKPGDDVALAVEGHAHEHDLIFREA
jgi:translation elongation factor EF-1alpha